jgi:polyisoprenoid-binding protein YceI
VRRPIFLAALAVLAVLALGACGAYVYYFSGLRTSPSQLGLSATPSPNATIAPAAGLAGRWTVGASSLAGYRVKELFVGQTSKHEAVARTSAVSGSLTVNGDSSGYQANEITITVALAGLQSQDQVAGRNVSQRDGVVARQLDVQQFPNASLFVASASVPAGVTGGPVDVSGAGRLTIHGVTRDVTVSAKAQVLGDKVEIAGSLLIDMNDYQVPPPQVPFVTVEPAVTIEFDVFLTKE